MKRKDFIKKAVITGVAGAVAPAMLKAKNVRLKHSDYDKMIEQTGFNHLPNKEEKTMNTVVHRANTRGHANHGWLNARHSFSFANYYNPERMNFGVLRVLNDDQIEAGKGFGTHPHDNMEIITIPIKGELAHKDSMGNASVIKSGEVQVMSAGTGVFHSEFATEKENVELLQIWMFPNQKNVTPRYDQIQLQSHKTRNELYQILSPSKEDEGVWVHQQAWFHLGNFDAGEATTYTLKKPENGVYLFVLEGQVDVASNKLNRRDGFGIWNTKSLEISALNDAKFLLMEVPILLS